VILLKKNRLGMLPVFTDARQQQHSSHEEAESRCGKGVIGTRRDMLEFYYFCPSSKWCGKA
jgi:hypothetical protein